MDNKICVTLPITRTVIEIDCHASLASCFLECVPPARLRSHEILPTYNEQLTNCKTSAYPEFSQFKKKTVQAVANLQSGRFSFGI